MFIMITSNKIKAGGILGYLKGFTTPIPVMTPFNVLSELATPVKYGAVTLEIFFLALLSTG